VPTKEEQQAIDAAQRKAAKQAELKAIREAVNRHRGGWEKASDEDIQRLWLSLPEATRQAYLKPPQEKSDDTQRDQPKPDA
jgi:hypothetical protein